MTHACVSKLSLIGAKPLSELMLTYCPLDSQPITYFNELSTEIQTFSYKKIHHKMASAPWVPFCLDLNVLSLRIITHAYTHICIYIHIQICVYAHTHIWNGMGEYQIAVHFKWCPKSYILGEYQIAVHFKWCPTSYILANIKLQCSLMPHTISILYDYRFGMFSHKFNMAILLSAHLLFICNSKEQNWHNLHNSFSTTEPVPSQSSDGLFCFLS